MPAWRTSPSDRFSRALVLRLLHAKGARLQRPLWASTSTKHNPDLPKAIYVESLIGPHTVNTVPPMAFDVFREHGKASLTLETGLPEARKAFTDLAALGVSIDQITRELEDEGVKAFADDYEALLNTIDTRREPITAQLGPLGSAVPARITQLDRDSVPTRLWEGDAALWADDPKGQDEIRRRMGWLNLPETSRPLPRRSKAICGGNSLCWYRSCSLAWYGRLVARPRSDVANL